MGGPFHSPSPRRSRRVSGGWLPVPRWPRRSPGRERKGFPFDPGAGALRGRGHASPHPGWASGGARGGGPGLQAPTRPHPLRGLSHRTGGHYQGFLSVLDVFLYSLNPLQEFLEEKFRGRGSKQARPWPLPHAMVGGVEARGWKVAADWLSQLFKVLSQS